MCEDMGGLNGKMTEVHYMMTNSDQITIIISQSHWLHPKQSPVTYNKDQTTKYKCDFNYELLIGFLK